MLVIAWAFALCGPPMGRAGEPTEITLRRTSKEFLFFRGESYYPGGAIPRDDALDPQAEQTALTDFSATIKAGEKGMVDIPTLRFECQGVRYVLPSHRIVVLEARQKEPGTFVEWRSDPNGSGNVEVIVGCRKVGEKLDTNIYVDYSKRPDKVEVLSSGSSSSQGNSESSWQMKVILRNRSDEPFILKQEFFKNLPESKDWPRIEIPPAPVEEEKP